MRCFGWNFVDFGSDFRPQVLNDVEGSKRKRDNGKEPSALSVYALHVRGNGMFEQTNSVSSC